jgi:hypothetical protein
MKPPRELARVRIMEEATVTVPLDPNLSIKALAGLAARSVPQRYLICEGDRPRLWRPRPNDKTVGQRS